MKTCAILVLALLALPAGAAIPPPAHPRSPLAAEARVRIDRVMHGPEFGHEVRHMALALRHHEAQKAQEQSAPPSWLEALINQLGALVRVAVALLLAGLAFAVYRSRDKWLPVLRAVLPSPATPAWQEALSDAPAPQALPEDVAAAAEASWREGDRRTALGLLYRGALARLDLPASATEGETLRLVRQRRSGPVVEDFTQLVRAWQGIAYAQRPPADFDALLAVFRRHFSGTVAS